MISIRIKKNIF